MTCPLCFSQHLIPYHSDKQRDYFHCQDCDLVFVPNHQRLPLDLEKAQYDLHQNSPSDQGYRKFLDKLLIPLVENLKDGDKGLDFGCGPGPTISVMLAERGFQVSNYDFFYYNQPELLNRQYDFITCTEVFEHFHRPKQEIELLTQLLKPKGVLGVMTKRVIDKQAFANWHYKNDPTHVCFYSEKTFLWIAHTYGFTAKFIANDTVLLFKD
ncbi:MAG: class I SAM-dependent methyltransferase [Kangiellaceae bacterium]|nr:class I SAM-dependent methyltransferase [Kangiellaceae bacterium]